MVALRSILVWGALGAAVLVPLIEAAASPLLAWRDSVYILAGFAGIAAFVGLLVQPLLAGGHLPGLSPRRARIWHRWVGAGLGILVILHVLGLWLTSPPDVVDALLLRSPTPFSIWGVIAMWALIAVGLMALLRRRIGLSPARWRLGHFALVTTVALSTVVHALLIEGTMGQVSKIALCVLVAVAVGTVVYGHLPWRLRLR